jgi:hypothetical protein
MPSTSPQLAGPPGGTPQVPTVLPAAIVQTPLQQLVDDVHTSPSCRQNEEALHCPPEQSPEQHSALEVHVLFSVLQVVLSGVHIPPEHVPLQHAAFELHAWLSEVHAGRLQTPDVHVPEQQSLVCWHAAPS